MKIEIRNLTVRFQEIVALDDVSGDFESGRITAIIGPNAAGKSTLLRACLGLTRRAKGSVEIDGAPVRRLRARELAQMAAYVPQQPTVAAAFTVRETIELGRYALGADSRRVEHALAQLELEQLEGRLFPELSVGQQQRVAVARALAQLEPGGCLLLDEPTAAMDFRHEMLTYRALKSLSREGATIVLTVHDINAATTIADDMWLLKSGRLLRRGPLDETLSATTLESLYDVPFCCLPDEAGRNIYLPRRDSTRLAATM